MKEQLLVVFWCAAIGSSLGYTITPCDGSNKVQFDENSDAELNCSDIRSDDMVWRITHTNGTVSQIGACYWLSGTCSVTNSDYSLSRPRRDTSVLTVTGNHRTKIAGTVMCAGLQGGIWVDEMKCGVRVVYTSYQVTNCAVAVTTIGNWTMSGSCDVDKIYASDGLYSCEWQRIPEKGPADAFPGRMRLTPFEDDSGKVYQRAKCSFSGKPMPTINGRQSYAVWIYPRTNQLAKAADIINIQPPAGPPVLHACPDFIIVGDDDICKCQPSAAQPPALVSWYNAGSAISSTIMLPLNNVPASLNGDNYTCKQYWGGFDGTSVMTITYVMNVKYPPPSSPTITGNTIYIEGGSLSLTCTVTGGNPPVTSVTLYCDGVHGDTTDIISTQNGQTEVISTFDISSLTSTDDGTRCLCSANWSPRPSLYTTTSTVTITVQGETSQTTAPSTSTKPPDGSSSTSSTKDKMRGDADDRDDDDNSVAFIAGGVAAAAVLIIIVVVVIVVVVRRRKGKSPREDTRPEDTEEDEEFEEHINVMYQSAEDVSSPQTKPSAVALRIPVAENTSPSHRNARASDPEDVNYTTIPSQHFAPPAPNGNVTDRDQDNHLYSSADGSVENPNPGSEVDPYSTADGTAHGTYDNPRQNDDTGTYSSVDGDMDGSGFVVSASATPQDANEYAVVNKKKPVPQNNDYAVVNKARTNPDQSAQAAGRGDADNTDPEPYLYAEVNKKSSGGNAGVPPAPKGDVGPHAQVQKPKPVPATKPKPAVGAKPAVPVKPHKTGDNENPRQGRPSATSGYEDVDLPNEEATVIPEDDYNTLAFHRPPPTELSGDPDPQYSHIGAV